MKSNSKKGEELAAVGGATEDCPYLVLGLETPSSTQQMCVLSSPTFTTQAMLNPALYVAQRDSCGKRDDSVWKGRCEG